MQKAKYIFSLGKEETIKRGEMLVDIGEMCQDIFFIKSGGFVVQFIDDNTGAEKTCNFLLQDYEPLFFIIECYLENIYSFHQIKAIKNTKILRFTKDITDKLWANDIEYRGLYLKVIESSLVLKHRFLSKALNISPVDTYNSISLNFPQIIKNVPSKYIAEYMGITPQWLSKIKRDSLL